MAANTVGKTKKEVDKNYDFFKTQISLLKRNHLNEFALLYEQKMSHFFTDKNKDTTGEKKYSDNFSVQQVDDSFTELGYQSHSII